jgi:Dinucleotide-utilizing enzymes involved in molybdopterin and thiamine biosynthesis family 1
LSHEFTRTELLIGKRGLISLSKVHILVFGIGGVGSYVVEALARSGVGTLTLVDNDEVMISNINRQLVALHSTIGKFKTEVAKERVKDINPNILVHTYQTFYDAQTSRLFDFKEYDYVVDAIDTVTSKLLIIEQAKASKTPVISCMGTGNKLDPSRLEITDISKTSVCPLAKVMRLELRKRRIKKVKVLYSKEQPIKIIETNTGTKGQGNTPTVGSVAYVPATAGLMIAGEVIKELINE